MKKSIRLFFIAFVALSILVSGCASPPAASPPPTEPETSTNTPLPTSTLEPSPTSTQVPTSTPDVEATNMAQATQITAERLDLIKKDLNLVGYPATGHLAWYQTDPISVVPTVSQHDEVVLIDEDLIVSNFILRTQITWSANSLVFCGFGFRSEANVLTGKTYEFNFFKFSGLPGWEIALWEGEDYLADITERTRYSDQILQGNNATNEIILVAQGNVFTVYINDVRQGAYYDYGKRRTEGQFYFLAWQDTGKSECLYENSWIWVFE